MEVSFFICESKVEKLKDRLGDKFISSKPHSTSILGEMLMEVTFIIEDSADALHLFHAGCAWGVEEARRDYMVD